MSSKSVFFKLVFTKNNRNLPITPEVEIYSRHDGMYTCMTPKITEAELDIYIDDLIAELQNIRQEGHRKFTKAKKQLKG